MYYCFKCGRELEVDFEVGRGDTCIHCGTDLHVCLNCILHEENSRNQCREPLSLYVRDRERSNFCHFFKFKEGKPEVNSEDVAAQAKSKLDALFKS